jgi:hypothetical protein
LQATVAGIVLGSQAHGNEVKLTCTIRRQSAFWDALPQLQQQGINQQQLQQHKQADGKIKLAKVFPRFVDEDLLAAVQHQEPSLSAVVEAGEGHGPRKEFFQAAALNWTKSAPQQVRQAHLVQQEGLPHCSGPLQQEPCHWLSQERQMIVPNCIADPA